MVHAVTDTNTANIARPYAKAAFSVAAAEEHFPLWSQALQHQAMIVRDPTVQAALKNPIVTQTQKAALLIDLLHVISGNGVARDYAQVENFLRLLTEQRRLLLLPEISDLFQQLVAEAEGYLQLTIVSAYLMSDVQQTRVKQRLEQQFSTQVFAEFLVDRALIGGLVIRSKQWVLDDSITGKLERLKSVLS